MYRILAFVGLIPACDLAHECTLMYVADSLEVAIEADTWAPGAWTASIDDLGCTVTLPGGADLACDEGLSLELTDDGSGIASLTTFDTAPETAVVVLAVDGVEVLRETVTPEYEESEPNGEGCGISRQGDVVITAR